MCFIFCFIHFLVPVRGFSSHVFRFCPCIFFKISFLSLPQRVLTIPAFFIEMSLLSLHFFRNGVPYLNLIYIYVRHILVVSLVFIFLEFRTAAHVILFRVFFAFCSLARAKTVLLVVVGSCERPLLGFPSEIFRSFVRSMVRVFVCSVMALFLLTNGKLIEACAWIK